MGKYTFVTAASVLGDEKQTVEILSKAEVERIAQAAASQAIGQWEPECERAKERLAKRIEQARQAAETAQGEAEKAEQAAIKAEKKAKTEANRLVEAARTSFRDIVAESLAPLLETGLKQALDNQATIRQEYKDLKATTADLALKSASIEEKATKLEKGTKELQTRIETLQADVTVIQRTAEKITGAPKETPTASKEAEAKWAELSATNQTLRNEIEALRAEVESARKADKAHWDTENKKLRSDMASLGRNVPGAARSGFPGGKIVAKTSVALWCVALLGVLLGLCGVASRQSTNTPQGPDRPQTTESWTQSATPAPSPSSSTKMPEEVSVPAPAPVEQAPGTEVDALLAKARKGDKDAYSQLGTWLLEGKEIGATEKEAVMWVLHACAARKKLQTAIPWLEDATRHGNQHAQKALNALEKRGTHQGSN